MAKTLIYLFLLLVLSCAERSNRGSDKTVKAEGTGFDDYEHTVQMTFNLEDTNGPTFDAPGYNLFAIPHIFENGIETSRYIALNFTGQISIWTHIFADYDRPGEKILKIDRLSEVVLHDPITLPYNGFLGGHDLVAGEWYYIVIRRDEEFRLNTGSLLLLPFGRKLASKNEGVSWIGWDNNTSWYRKSGVIMSTVE